MTTRNDILKVAVEYGWRETGDPLNEEFLELVRQPDPTALLGGPRLLVEVRFKNEEQVAECRTGVDRLNVRRLGGAKAIKRYLRWDGHKS